MASSFPGLSLLLLYVVLSPAGIESQILLGALSAAITCNSRNLEATILTSSAAARSLTASGVTAPSEPSPGQLQLLRASCPLTCESEELVPLPLCMLSPNGNLESCIRVSLAGPAGSGSFVLPTGGSVFCFAMRAADVSLAVIGFAGIKVVWVFIRPIGGIQSSFAAEKVKIVGQEVNQPSGLTSIQAGLRHKVLEVPTSMSAASRYCRQ